MLTYSTWERQPKGTTSIGSGRRVPSAGESLVSSATMTNRRLLWATILGGCVFLVVKGFEWTSEIQAGFTISSNTFWSFYYTAAGIHASHVLAGAIVMMFVARDAAQNRELHRVELAGIYWHFVDVVWIFLFPLLYIAK